MIYQLPVFHMSHLNVARMYSATKCCIGLQFDLQCNLKEDIFFFRSGSMVFSKLYINQVHSFRSLSHSYLYLNTCKCFKVWMNWFIHPKPQKACFPVDFVENDWLTFAVTYIKKSSLYYDNNSQIFSFLKVDRNNQIMKIGLRLKKSVW